MIAGLSVDEQQQVGLEGYTVRDLQYLNLGKFCFWSRSSLSLRS